MVSAEHHEINQRQVQMTAEDDIDILSAFSAEEMAALEPVTDCPAPYPGIEPEVEARQDSEQEPAASTLERIGKYNLISGLGEGTLGRVYEGLDPSNGSRVAVKVLRKDSQQLAADGGMDAVRKAFFREAEIFSLMQHPHILHVLDSGEEEENCYIVTELVEDAHTLKEHITPGNLLPHEQTAEIICQCAQALAHVHRRNIVHCDIKPENILLSAGGFVKIADFGIARQIGEGGDDSGEDEGDLLGSPRYMSPEQIKSESLNYKTDLFSLGIVFYEMLTGCHPFHASSLESLMQKIFNEVPLPLQERDASIPAVLQAVVDRALCKDAEGRYSSGVEMAEGLSQAYPDLQRMQSGMDAQELFQAVRSLGFFSEFTDAELRELVQNCNSEEYAEGTQIISEGIVKDSGYILIEGQAEVTKAGISLTRLAPGACFGEMGYLTGIRRTATVLATSNCRVLKLNAALVGRQPDRIRLKLSEAFIRVLVQRLEQTTRILTAR